MSIVFACFPFRGCQDLHLGRVEADLDLLHLLEPQILFYFEYFFAFLLQRRRCRSLQYSLNCPKAVANPDRARLNVAVAVAVHPSTFPSTAPLHASRFHARTSHVYRTMASRRGLRRLTHQQALTRAGIPTLGCATGKLLYATHTYRGTRLIQWHHNQNIISYCNHRPLFSESPKRIFMVYGSQDLYP